MLWIFQIWNVNGGKTKLNISNQITLMNWTLLVLFYVNMGSD